MCETWENDLDFEIQDLFPGYCCFTKKENTIIGRRGLLILVKNSYAANCTISITDDPNSLFIEFIENELSTVYIGILYNPPLSQSYKEPISLLNAISHIQMLKQNKNNTVILMGDFNARLPSQILGDHQSNAFGKNLLQSTQENNLSIISPSTRANPIPTCITKQGKSMIDHIICPKEIKHLIKNCNIDPLALFANPSNPLSVPTSDHMFIHFDLERTSPTKPLNWGQYSLLFNWNSNKKSLYQITTKTLLKTWNDKWKSSIKSKSDIETAEKEMLSFPTF